MQVIIRPVDVWLFRDGKPFMAGEDHVVESLFPPSPFTLQGAIRTKVLVDKGINPTEFAKQKQPHPDIGYGDNYGKLRLCGPILARQRNGKWERLIRMPADVVKTEDGFALLKPNYDLPFFTNLPADLRLPWIKTNQPVKEVKGWLPESEWAHYLNGEAPKHMVSDEELFMFESRFGIAIEHKRRTTQEAMLYQARFVRLKDNVALWAEIEGVPLKDKGFLRFGGEGRAATYEVLAKNAEKSESLLFPSSERQHLSNESKHFKVVLITPAWFSDGWQPVSRDWQKVFNVSVKLVAATIPRPQLLGSFDVAKGIPRPTRAFVPAGAVYFFEAEQPLQVSESFTFTETPEDVRQQNNGTNAWSQIGFGKALVGRW